MTTPKPAEGAKPILPRGTETLLRLHDVLWHWKGGGIDAEAALDSCRAIIAAPSPEGVGLPREAKTHDTNAFYPPDVGQEGPSEPEGGG